MFWDVSRKGVSRNGVVTTCIGAVVKNDSRFAILFAMYYRDRHTIRCHFRFRFMHSAESRNSLSMNFAFRLKVKAHFRRYNRFRPNMKSPLSVSL